MTDDTNRLRIVRIAGGKVERITDAVTSERPATILVNDIEIATLMCSPKDLECLAVGFLFGEGLIRDKKDLKEILANEKDGAVWVTIAKANEFPTDLVAKRFITTGCGKGLTFVDATRSGLTVKVKPSLRVPHESVHSLMKEFLRRSQAYRLTGAVHGAALCDKKDIIVFKEDIGRHNAIDKVIGECILKGIRTDDKIIITSGRVTSEILIRAARSRAQIIVSKSAPTDLAVKLADDFGITLVGFVRGERMNVYSNPTRIATSKSRK